MKREHEKRCFLDIFKNAVTMVFVMLCSSCKAFQSVHQPQHSFSFVLQAEGFGSNTSQKSSRQIRPKLSPLLSQEARNLMKKHHGNVDAASTAFFQQRMAQLIGNTNAAQEQENLDNLFAKRMAASWDAIAMFLPLDYNAINAESVDSVIRQRLQHISTACIATSTAPHNTNIDVLDVGCGDGAIVPYLMEELSRIQSSKKLSYFGMDISSGMISLAKRKLRDSSFSDKKGVLQQSHATVNFAVGEFPMDVKNNDKDETRSYSCILFNGSLQFFPDTFATLAHAKDMLATGGHIVLSHVRGERFVKEECQKNPSLAVRKMPNRMDLLLTADQLGMRVLPKSELLLSAEMDGTNDLDDQNNGDFYLVALEKKE